MSRNRAVFLDRDGVLNLPLIRDGKPYPPRSLEEMTIVDDAVSALPHLKHAGYLLIVITNQPDVVRGTTTRGVVESINDQLSSVLPLDHVLTCYDDGDTPRRKPNPGMILEAAEQFDIDPAESFVVGDRWKDIEAGARAGCRTVFIDYEYQEAYKGAKPDYTTKRLADAVDWILAQPSRGAV